MMNILAYADDMVLLASSWRGLQCMIFNPRECQKIVFLSFIWLFLRVLRRLFTRTNILVCCFAKCLVDVKITLLRSYCICFFDTALWMNVKQSIVKKLEYAYVKCLKMFLNFP